MELIYTYGTIGWYRWYWRLGHWLIVLVEGHVGFVLITDVLCIFFLF
jgi:hypothetical protein